MKKVLINNVAYNFTTSSKGRFKRYVVNYKGSNRVIRNGVDNFFDAAAKLYSYIIVNGERVKVEIV